QRHGCMEWLQASAGLLRGLGGREMKLQDRVAIVTGAAQGIGKAVADKLAAEGAKVVAVDVNGEGAERTAAGVDGTAVQADISSPEDVERMVDETVSQHGKVD